MAWKNLDRVWVLLVCYDSLQIIVIVDQETNSIAEPISIVGSRCVGFEFNLYPNLMPVSSVFAYHNIQRSLGFFQPSRVHKICHKTKVFIISLYISKCCVFFTVQVFYKPMVAEKILTRDELEAIFVNWRELIMCNRKLLM